MMNNAYQNLLAFSCQNPLGLSAEKIKKKPFGKNFRPESRARFFIFLALCIIALVLRAPNTFYTQTGHLDWSDLPNKRVLVIRFASAEKVLEFSSTWANHEENLLSQTSNSTILLAFPHLDFESIESEIVEKLDWRYVESYNHAHPFAAGPLLFYKTKGGIDVFLQPLYVHLPHYYLKNPVVPYCADRTWPLTYAMYSGAVFSYHIPLLPIVSKYDYYLKIDADIYFHAKMPFDIGEQLDTRNCVVGHTAIEPSNDCESLGLHALKASSLQLGLPPPKSENYSWCNEDMRYQKASILLFGNFLAFSTKKLLLQPEIKMLATQFYEEYDDGYFSHRWTDQAPFVMFVCYLLDIPDIQNDSQMCDFRSLRGPVFTHGPRTNSK